jgi:hypothetical protein
MVRVIGVGVLSLFFALLALAMRDEVVALCVMGGIAVLLAILGICDALFGPSASCSLRTAVQVEPLPSLNRVRRARQVLNRLKPLIAVAQGTLTSEEIVAQMQARPAATAAQSAAPALPAASAGEIPPRIMP